MTDLFKSLNEFRPKDAPPLRQAPLLRPEPEILPPEPGMGRVVLFDESDIAQALAIYDASATLDRAGAMREVMMHALRCAAINLNVRDAVPEVESVPGVPPDAAR